MDLLTHFTLGAACGEAVLGKKIGNRAMVWGAAGGLLPDLDVLASLVTDEITALAFHRGPMHSLAFVLLSSLALSWLAERIYRGGHFKRRWYRLAVFSFLAFLLVAIAGSLNYFAFSPKSGLNLQVLAATLAACVWLTWLLWKKYYRANRDAISATRWQWFQLFGVTILGHVALDCFTSYGTQLFQPFSNYPVAFNSISVLDPLYTLPFLACLLAVTAMPKDKKSRRLVNWLGIGISSAYLVFTVWHKGRADRIFERSLAMQGIQVQRFVTSPTILNNFLWQGVAEGDTAFYHGSFSFFDEEPLIRQFNILPKNHDLAAPHEGDRAIQVLRWFTRGYFSMLPLDGGKLQLNDLRYGSTEENFAGEDKYVFRFILEEKNGRLSAHQLRAYHRMSAEGLGELVKRIRGKGRSESAKHLE